MKLHTVCESAHCPNLGECFSQDTLTFMIMGNVCTRNCRFCAVESSATDKTSQKLLPLDPEEPERVAETAKELGLNYVVVTSVTRDDLPDGGAGHFAKTILALKKAIRGVEVEVLIPDLAQTKTKLPVSEISTINIEALETILAAGPTVLNHNIEMVKRLYPIVRPQSNYDRSLSLLLAAKSLGGGVCTKSGFMLGLGEIEAEVLGLLQDIRTAQVDFVTIGQYLPPSKAHFPVNEYISPETFAKYKQKAEEMGFRQVFSGPLVRSSYHAKKLWKNQLD